MCYMCCMRCVLCVVCGSGCGRMYVYEGVKFSFISKLF